MPKQTQWGIYAWYHMPTLRTYVGQTGPTQGFKERRKVHLRDLRSNTHHSRFLQRAWNQHGESEFAWVMLQDMTEGDTEQLTPREQFWMDNTDSVFNSCPAAGSSLGYTVPQDVRDKISESTRGKTFSAETRARISEAKRGKPTWITGKHQTDEHRANISAALRGKPLSSEHRAKLSAAHRGRGHPMSAEARAKIGAAHRGKTYSDETRAKISEAKRGHVPWNKGISTKHTEASV